MTLYDHFPNCQDAKEIGWLVLDGSVGSNEHWFFQTETNKLGIKYEGPENLIDVAIFPLTVNLFLEGETGRID